MGAEGAFYVAFMIGDMRPTAEAAGWGLIGDIAASRSYLLSRFERWTYGRKIKLCTGLSGNVVVASEVIRAHGLTQDEIDPWMDSYKKGGFEALKVRYARKRKAKRKIASSSWLEHADTVASG